MTKNIVFDVGKVLVSFEPVAYLESLGYDKKTRDILTSAIFQHPLWVELDRGVLPFSEVMEGFLENAPGYEKEIKEVFEKLGQTIELMPYAVEWTEELKSQGFHLYIISNYGEYLFEQTKDKMKFLEYMDGVIFSYQCKKIKPNLEIYEELLKKYHLNADESVFIDDCLENVEAAENVGYHGIQFLDYEQAKVELENMNRKPTLFYWTQK